ncbi:uncharacterized protein LY89DRAFT_733626 [Mollisia scopiformis]|uniref:Uncharacterized protein n=1 Tax=Mollisia scopiformis TaxID=149040 RepID=A0A194XCB5_MOLSC|nr:uncharacterized protein LY89DRAFT_733626 [Mollisia scopiformis]KUJ17804.1 hypothetical protein LY89DRAFT_733626 [Mollisia scopiformis]
MSKAKLTWEAARKAYEELETAGDFKPPSGDIVAAAIAFSVMIAFEYRPRKKDEPFVPELFVKDMLGDCAATQIDALLDRKGWHHLDRDKLKRTAAMHVGDLY